MSATDPRPALEDTIASAPYELARLLRAVSVLAVLPSHRWVPEAPSTALRFESLGAPAQAITIAIPASPCPDCLWAKSARWFLDKGEGPTEYTSWIELLADLRAPR